MTNLKGLFIPKQEDIKYFTDRRNEALLRFNDAIEQNLNIERIENRYHILMRKQKQLFLYEDAVNINDFIKSKENGQNPD